MGSKVKSHRKWANWTTAYSLSVWFCVVSLKYSTHPLTEEDSTRNTNLTKTTTEELSEYYKKCPI